MKSDKAASDKRTYNKAKAKVAHGSALIHKRSVLTNASWIEAQPYEFFSAIKDCKKEYLGEELKKYENLGVVVD